MQHYILKYSSVSCITMSAQMAHKKIFFCIFKTIFICTSVCKNHSRAILKRELAENEMMEI